MATDVRDKVEEGVGGQSVAKEERGRRTIFGWGDVVDVDKEARDKRVCDRVKVATQVEVATSRATLPKEEGKGRRAIWESTMRPQRGQMAQNKKSEMRCFNNSGCI